MSKLKYMFMSSFGIHDQLQSAFDRADFETVKEIFSLKRGLQERELKFWIEKMVYTKLEGDNDKIRWEGLLNCAIDRLGSDELSQKYYCDHLFLRPALVKNSPELVNIVFETAKKRNINIDAGFFNLNNHLAFFLPLSEKDQRASEIVDILIRNGADLGRAVALNERWVKSNDEQIQKAQQALDDLIAQKEKSSENLCAANRAAAARQKKPSL